LYSGGGFLFLRLYIPIENNYGIRLSWSKRNLSASVCCPCSNILSYHFLSGTKTKEDGTSFAEIQRKGNLAYQQLPENERQEYEAAAADANKYFVPLSSGSITKKKMIKRIIQNIDNNKVSTAHLISE
jgi:hypothetical protein